MRLKLIILVLLVQVSACSLLPDNRDTYRRSETMPDLEVPPDLTAETINERMAIPGERNRPPGTAQPPSQTEE